MLAGRVRLSDEKKPKLEVVDEAKGLLMVGFQRRFDPDFSALKAVIDAVGGAGGATLTARVSDTVKRVDGRDMVVDTVAREPDAGKG